MTRRILPIAVFVLVVGAKPVMAQRVGNLPLAFEPNQGQTDGRVRFVSRGGGYTLFLTDTGAVLALDDAEGVAIRASVAGGRPVRAEGADPLAGRSNYIVGNDPRFWQMGVPQFERVRYSGIYPGIDLLFYGNQRQLEYDFVVAPGRDPSVIKLAIDGAHSVHLDSNGDLILGTRSRPVRMQRPIAYQEVDGIRRAVAVRYRLMRGGTVGFVVGRHDTTAPLVIDPIVLVHSSYLGGFGWDQPNDMAVDAAGNIYVTGLTEGRGFPVSAGGQLATSVSTINAFVTKIDSSGSSVVYSTIFGGSGFDNSNAIAVDASGAAVVAGGTGSADFPIVGGLQTGLRGTDDGFLLKLAPDGASFMYSTLFGGSASDYINHLALTASGEVYLAGSTDSADFPVRSAVQPSFGGTRDAFVAKLNADASQLIYSTYLGGSNDEYGARLAVDAAGSVYLVGSTRSSDFPTANALEPAFHPGPSGGFYPDAFVAKLSPDGSALVYSTYLGGSTWDTAGGVAVDAAGNAYVVGTTDSWEFPRVGGIPRTNYAAYPDAYLAKFNSTGSALLFSTTLGGSRWDSGARVALDPAGNVWIAGWTESADFPVKSPFQSAFAGGWDDGFVAKLTPQGSSLLASTYFGGSAHEYISGMAIDAAGSVIIAGATSSPDLPLRNAFQASIAATPDQQGTQSGLDAYVAKLTWEPDPVLTADAGPDLIVAANESCSGQVTLDGTKSTAPPGRFIWAYLWTGPNWMHAEGPTPTFPLAALGTYIFGLTVYDDRWNRATDSVNVTLADLDGPAVGGVTATPAVLWPPNRQMVPVTVTVADVTDACSGPVTCRIESVTSNEPLAPGDYVITGDLTLELRADRLGEGHGRTYSIVVACTDAAGNSTRKTVTVLVPHEM